MGIRRALGRASSANRRTAASVKGALPATARRRVAILGATGSIGESSLRVIGEHPERFEITTLTAQDNAEKLIHLATLHRPSLVAIGNEAHFATVRDALKPMGIQVLAGAQGIEEAASMPADITSAAIVGAAGLLPTLRAIEQGTSVAIANKEALVCAGALVMKLCATHGTRLLPIDSEHNAIFQVLNNAQRAEVEKITLTASGGPLLSRPLETLHRVTPEEAVNHPRWSMGAKISVVEYTDAIVGAFDRILSKELQKSLQKLGFEFYMQHKVTAASTKGKTATVKAVSLKDNSEIELKGDYVLVSTGRRPYTDGLNLEKAGLAADERGRIPVNENCETAVAGIYAIGDVVRGAMLAHKAEEEGVFVAEHMAGQHPHINHLLIPNVVYTWPEVASVGYTEEQLKEQKRAYKSGSFPFKASGRARASMDTDGLVKVLADSTTDEILGVHMIGPRVADMIAEAVVAMEFRASAEDIARISHAHPTFTESFREAALAATDNRALHI